MKTDNFRYILQIKFINNGDPHWFSMWDINEPYKQLIQCQEDSEILIDNTVEKARIVDTVNGNVINIK